MKKKQKKVKQRYQLNLVPQDPFLETGLGKFFSWALGAGRYLVIFTEMVVIMSFASRFVLDRQITDLNDSIYQKQIIIQSQSQFENEFRLAQLKIQNLQQLQQQANIVEAFPLIQRVIPNDLRLNKLVIKQQSLNGEGVALSNRSLNTFISNLQLSPHFSDIRVGRIESREERKTGFEIQFSANYSLQ